MGMKALAKKLVTSKSGKKYWRYFYKKVPSGATGLSREGKQAVQLKKAIKAGKRAGRSDYKKGTRQLTSSAKRRIQKEAEANLWRTNPSAFASTFRSGSKRGSGGR